jgi:transaldolase
MKLFLETEDFELPIKYQEIGIIDGVWSGRSIPDDVLINTRDLIIKNIRNIKLPYIIQSQGFEMDDIIENSKSLATLGNEVIVEYPFTREVLKANQFLKKIGIDLVVNHISYISQVLLSAKAGVKYIIISYPNNQTFIENTVELFENYGHETLIMVNQIEKREQLEHLTLMGVDGAIVRPEILDNLLEQ